MPNGTGRRSTRSRGRRSTRRRKTQGAKFVQKSSRGTENARVAIGHDAESLTVVGTHIVRLPPIESQHSIPHGMRSSIGIEGAAREVAEGEDEGGAKVPFVAMLLNLSIPSYLEGGDREIRRPVWQQP